MSSIVSGLSYGVGIGAVLLLLLPRVRGVIDRLDTPWLDAWLKSTVIVVAVIVLTVIIPDRVVRSGPVAKLSGFSKDLIGVGVWAAGLALVLGGLWYAHRESRV